MNQTNNKASPHVRRTTTFQGSLTMYLLFAAPALSFVAILVISLYSEFAAKANL
jgi:hypothetical protein